MSSHDNSLRVEQDVVGGEEAWHRTRNHEKEGNRNEVPWNDRTANLQTRTQTAVAYLAYDQSSTGGRLLTRSGVFENRQQFAGVGLSRFLQQVEILKIPSGWHKLDDLEAPGQSFTHVSLWVK